MRAGPQTRQQARTGRINGCAQERGRQNCDVNVQGATLRENREVAMAVCNETNKGVDVATAQVLLGILKAAMLQNVEKRQVAAGSA